MASLSLPTGPTVGYDDADGDGAVVVCSHGFLLDRSMWRANVPAWAPPYRVVTWDQRGHGETTDAGEPFSYWDSARDLLALLDALSVPQAVLVGMSQGGFVSLRAALLAPERVRALVLIDSQAGLEQPEARPLYEAMAQTWLGSGPTEELARLVGPLILSPDHVDEWLPRWLSRPKEALGAPFRTLMDRDDLTDRLGEIGVPALVVHGTQDLSIPMERAEALAEGLPGARPLVRVEGGAHASNVSHPAEVNAAVRAFLDNLPR